MSYISPHVIAKIKKARYKNLTFLDLSNNQLTELPESLGQLTNLTTLHLHNNKLTKLPEFLGKLTNLTTLNLYSNKLTELPESLGRLTNLTYLRLSNNKLTELPESLGRLTNLTHLRLSNNQLTQIPESLGWLTNLTYLRLSNNQLTQIPESLGRLTKLTYLNLDNNQLTELPESLGRLTKLTYLNLDNNPLETPPIEVAEKGIKEIREYFKQLEEEGKDYLYEAKLLIVGEAGAGKTTLANKIQNQDYELKEEDSTKGIDVIQHNFNLKNGQNFRVNIWDFGGQEIYKETHQFFLTKRSLYTLVIDDRKEDDNCHYWLNIVELLTEDSPILIIKNEKQDRQKEINESALRERFNHLKETLATNLSTKRGLPEILNKIEHYISNLPHVGDVLPKTWKRVREVLEQDNRNYISLPEYLDICQENGFKTRENKLQLSGYLHDLGVCLHFQEDPLLNKTVILKPEWGTAAVYRVLDNKTVINNKGKFTKNDLANIWNKDEYIDMRDELLQLMMKFKLCYEIAGQLNTYIAPQLLSNNQPDYHELWDDNNNLILRYTYEFMPKGIITQFIVVMHKDIEQQKYVWKSGVLLNKDKTKAEVIEYYDKREIKIRVYGQNKRDLMTIVTHEIDKLHDSYKRLICSKLIPCNCEKCKNNQNPHFYEYDKLRERIANQKFTIECGNPPYNIVDVQGLIDHTFKREQPKTRKDEVELEHHGQIVINNNIVGANAMSEQSKNDFRGASFGGGYAGKDYTGDVYNQSGKIGIGHMSGGEIKDKAIVAGEYNEAQQQNLAQAAADIQALLTNLETSYNINTQRGQIDIAYRVVEEIDNNPQLIPTKRILSALKAGSIQALDSLLDHPAASFVIGALEDWKNNQ